MDIDCVSRNEQSRQLPHRGARVTPEEIIAWARETMASHKYPRVVEIRDALPLTDTGKVPKRELC